VYAFSWSRAVAKDKIIPTCTPFVVYGRTEFITIVYDGIDRTDERACMNTVFA
jgi:hypothetical protein